MTITDQISQKAAFRSSLMLRLLFWGLALLVSGLPVIIWVQVSGGSINNVPWWIAGSVASCLVVVCLLARLQPLLRPLWRGCLTLLAFEIGWQVVIPLIYSSPIWQQWFNQAPMQGFQLVAWNLVRLLPACLMMLTFIKDGSSRADLFLVRGNLRVPLQIGKFTINSRLAWPIATCLFIVIAGVILPAYLLATVHPDLSLIGGAASNLPVILLSAAINTSSEELAFRSAILGRSLPVLGQWQALWLTTSVFGIGHFYGEPSGLIGVLLAGAAGFLWGLSTLETKSLTYAWLMHFIQDVVIFSFLVMLS